jgi:hypothetical protein
MPDNQLPAGLLLWPDNPEADRRIGVVISDIHCTDCTVGNQTADETDWQNFFRELEVMLDASITATSEILLILNGDVVDLLRSGKWAAANVYPWQRDKPEFKKIVLDIMHNIVEKHTQHPVDVNVPSGFFHYLQELVQNLRKKTSRVTLIPIVGNHDKELQVVPEARAIYYQQCLGLTEGDLGADYRNWVAAQMGSDPAEIWPLLPFYFAGPHLRLFATHGQWRDSTNSRSTGRWNYCKGWQPQLWQQEQYQPFSDSCFGDTIASGLLSHYIWNTTQAIERYVIPNAVNRSRDDGIDHILNVLREMDLYRPAASAVVRLLEEARKLDLNDPDSRMLYKTVIDQYRNSLQSWLGHPETFSMAPLGNKIVLYVVSFLSRLHWAWLDTLLMRLMAWVSEMKKETTFAKLPAFLDDYRPLGFRLHTEGHSHVTMEVDLRYSPPLERRNYTYVNTGAWRNRIVPKFDNMGFRRRSIGRALIVQGNANSESIDNAYGFTLRDITSWGDGLDRW